jgi:hypothetical protein
MCIGNVYTTRTSMHWKNSLLNGLMKKLKIINNIKSLFYYNGCSSNYKERCLAQSKTSLLLNIFCKKIKHVDYLQMYNLHSENKLIKNAEPGWLGLF